MEALGFECRDTEDPAFVPWFLLYRFFRVRLPAQLELTPISAMQAVIDASAEEGRKAHGDEMRRLLSSFLHLAGFREVSAPPSSPPPSPPPSAR